MPLYDFQCVKCEEYLERVVKLADAEKTQLHEDCGGVLKRVLLNAPKAREKTRYGGMQAVIVDRNEKTVGRVKGHFGKTAKRNRK